MIVEVMSGATVVIKPAAAARPYFRFVDGFGLGADNELPTGDTGFYLCRLPTQVGGWPGDGFLPGLFHGGGPGGSGRGLAVGAGSPDAGDLHLPAQTT